MQCIIGKRGVPQLRIDGNVFFKKATYKTKTFWYCKFHRGKGKCPATCWTVGTNVVKWPNAHNHPMPYFEEDYYNHDYKYNDNKYYEEYSNYYENDENRN